MRFKKLFSIFILIFSISISNCQVTKKTCYLEGRLVGCDEDYDVYRLYLGKDTDDSYIYRWYFKGEDSLIKMEGKYADILANRSKDILKSYYKNQKVRSISLFDNTKLRSQMYWFPNGQKALEIEMLNKLVEDKTIEFTLYKNAWDENGNELIKDGNGYLTKEASEIIFDKHFYYGKVKNGLKYGEWKQKHSTFQDYTLIYDKGVLQEKRFLNENGEKVKVDAKTEREFIEMASLEIRKDLLKNLLDFETDEFYRAYIKFRISDEGTLEDVRITNTLNNDLMNNLRRAYPYVKIKKRIMKTMPEALKSYEYQISIIFSPAE